MGHAEAVQGFGDPLSGARPALFPAVVPAGAEVGAVGLERLEVVGVPAALAMAAALSMVIGHV
jgi:hypothetical protein